jgi:3-hydroxyacyl-[acyl-carrier-protein] dehydratase
MESKTPAPSIPPPILTSDARAALLRHFPQDVRGSYLSFGATGDPAAADAVILAVVRDHIPNKGRRSATALDDRVALVADLGFDSVAIAELVFFIEDLFQVSLSNADLAGVRSVGDLRAHMRRRLAGQIPAASAPPA